MRRHNKSRSFVERFCFVFFPQNLKHQKALNDLTKTIEEKNRAEAAAKAEANRAREACENLREEARRAAAAAEAELRERETEARRALQRERVNKKPKSFCAFHRVRSRFLVVLFT